MEPAGFVNLEFPTDGIEVGFTLSLGLDVVFPFLKLEGDQFAFGCLSFCSISESLQLSFACFLLLL